MTTLWKFELSALADAVRRDMQHELEKVHTDPSWKEVHEYNARMDRDLLERINPKHTKS